MNISTFKSSQYVCLSNSVLIFAILLSKSVAIFLPLQIQIFFFLLTELLFANKSYGFCKASLWTQAVTSSPVPTRQSDNYLFSSISNLTNLPETTGSYKDYPFFFLSEFSFLLSTIHLFPIRFIILIFMYHNCDAKAQKRQPDGHYM